MGQCTLRFNQIQIQNKKSDSDHSDNDWLSLVWRVNNDPDGIQVTVPLINTDGSQILDSGNAITPFEQSIFCNDADTVVAFYAISNFGSTDWGDQAAAASKVTEQIAKATAEVYLEAVKYALALIGAGFSGAPPAAVIIAQVLRPVMDQFSGKIADLVDVVFQEVITPAVAYLADQAANILGHPNCNGEVMHDFFVFTPSNEVSGGEVVIPITKTYEGPQQNSYCGTAPHTQIDLTGVRQLDTFLGQFGPVIQQSQGDMAMQEFRQRAEVASQQGYVGAFPNFYYATYGRANVGGTIFIKPGCGEWRDVPWAELGWPPLEDFGARMRATHDYAIRNGFVGGFPNFFQADRVGVASSGRIASTPLSAVAGRGAIASGAATGSGLGRRINTPSGIYNLSGGGSGILSRQIIETVCGTVLIDQACGVFRDVPLWELGNPSLTDIAARFRATQDYAIKNGFVGGFPNFYNGTLHGIITRHGGSGTVCGTILLTAEAADRQDVLLWLGPA